MSEPKNEMWAVVELMGHGQTAGIIKQSDLGGLLRVDVPVEDGFRTEYYGEQAIYAIRIVSEEIARAFSEPRREIQAFDTPIVPRADFEKALQKHRNQNEILRHEIQCLKKRLTTVNSLPPVSEDDYINDVDDENPVL